MNFLDFFVNNTRCDACPIKHLFDQYCKQFPNRELPKEEKGCLCDYYQSKQLDTKPPLEKQKELLQKWLEKEV